MNILEKLKQNIQNLDVNSAMASLVTMFGSLNTTDVIQLIYTSLSIFSAVWTIRVSSRKNKLDEEYRKVEIDLKRADLDERKLQINKQRKDEQECDTKTN